MKANCEICDKEIDVQMCCSGHDCGCMGKPVEPPVCSKGCFKKYMIKNAVNLPKEIGDAVNDHFWDLI